MPHPESMGVAAISLAQSFGFFQSYMPPLADVRKSSPNDRDLAGDVRTGEAAAFVGSLAVGIIVSWITGDPTPAYVSFIVSALMIGLYEMIFRSQRPLET
jgi:hypothetical protein